MADDEDQEQQEQNDGALSAVRDAARRHEKAAKAATTRADEAQAQVAELQSQMRQRDVTAQFAALNLGDKAGLYPSDREPTPEAVGEFVKEFGLSAPTADAGDWGRYEKMQAEQTGAHPARNELSEALAKGNDELEKMTVWYSKPDDYGPQSESWRQQAKLQQEAEPAILRGESSGLISPSGFGGPFDAPLWAQTWRKSS